MRDLPIGTVVFDGVSKRYRLGALGTLRGTVAALTSRGRDGDSPRDLWALRDVSFRVEPGDALGLIGPNGAGKTTALKLLSHITQPTSGRIQVSGRTASLIELGAGFHPELSGRENIYLNGAILGLKRREIARRFDEIVAFSELERFLDTPVKRFSSGMYVRLAFAVAAHVQPDVLLVDEVLAVGDASFRNKCMERIDDLRSSGTTIVFVSHNMAQVERLCKQAMLLVAGRVAFLGDATGALAAYQRHLHTERGTNVRIHADSATDELLIRAVYVLDATGQRLTDANYDQAVSVQIHYYAAEPVSAPLTRIWLVRRDGTVCAMSASTQDEDQPWILTGEGIISVRIAPLQLVSGHYRVEVMIVDRGDSTALAGGHSDSFYVQGPWPIHRLDPGIFVPSAQWLHQAAEASYERLGVTNRALSDEQATAES